MSGRLQGQVAIVTGGATGIGRACVVKLLTEGARVLFTDIAAEGGREALAQLHAASDSVAFLAGDVTEPDALRGSGRRGLRPLGADRHPGRECGASVRRHAARHRGAGLEDDAQRQSLGSCLEYEGSPACDAGARERRHRRGLLNQRPHRPPGPGGLRCRKGGRDRPRAPYRGRVRPARHPRQCRVPGRDRHRVPPESVPPRAASMELHCASGCTLTVSWDARESRRRSRMSSPSSQVPRPRSSPARRSPSTGD